MVDGGPQKTPAGKSEEYASPPPPVTTAPVPLASTRKDVEFVAGRKRTVPGTEVSEYDGGVKEALRRGGRRELAAYFALSHQHTHVYKAEPFTTRMSAMEPGHKSKVADLPPIRKIVVGVPKTSVLGSEVACNTRCPSMKSERVDPTRVIA